MRWIVRLALVVLTCVLNCEVVWAQAAAQMSGTVRDQSGAVLPGVEITAAQTKTGVVRTTVTNETGSWNSEPCLLLAQPNANFSGPHLASTPTHPSS